MEGKVDSLVDCRSGGGRKEMDVDLVDEVGVDMDGLDVNMDWELAEEDELSKALSREEMEVEGFSFLWEDEEEESVGEAHPEVQPVLSKAFDMKTLQTAMQASAEALDLVVGKDVVMVTGKTGVGKSTLMQAIAGKQIQTVEHKTSISGDIACKTVYGAKDALPAFEIGHTKKSKTSSLNALLRGETNIVYLDSPGVEDTGGVEMDIATSSLLSQVAKRCKSLRFVILVHCASLLEDRGGAFRSVLKFVRTFVQDFNQSKESFMFLFTHTDEITGMSKSFHDAKKHLQEEIMRTVEGTEDDDVLMVLAFIRRSLKKNYPFVQIFHPVKTDVLPVTAFIEKQLKKVTDLTLASTCSLTLSSKLKLEGAVQSLVQSLRVTLRESSQDLAQAKDIENRLQYLAEYIDVDCVRHAATEGKEIIDEHIKILKSSVKDLVLRGTSSDLEFNSVHVQTLQNTLLQLEELVAHGGSKRHLEIIRSSLQKFQEKIFAKVHSLDPFHKELKKVSIWAQGFDAFVPIHAVLCKKITDYIQELSRALSNADISSLDTASHKGADIFVYHLYKLYIVSDQLAQFPTADIDIDDAISAKNSATQKLKEVFKSWSLNAKKFAKLTNFADYEDDLDMIASQVSVLDSIQEFIQVTLKDHNRGFLCLEEHVINTKKSLEDEVTGRFYQCCTKLHGQKFDLSWKLQLFWMQAVCSRFADMQSDSWQRMQSSFFSLVDEAKSCLYKASGELETMFRMVSTHGITNGESLAKELLSLESFMWFDRILRPNQKFVEKCCDRVRYDIDTRIQKKHMELKYVNMGLSLHSPESIKEIGLLIPELREIDIYSSLANNAEGIEDPEKKLTVKCIVYLEKYADDLSILASKCIKHWVSNRGNGRIGYQRSMSRKLNHVLADAEALLNTDAPGDVMKKSRNILSVFLHEFAKFKKILRKEFSSFEGMFDKKAAFLVCLKACSGFSYVERQLVDYKKLQHHVRDLVSKEATKLEEMIGSTADWDHIDKCLDAFKTAMVIDPFVSEEVSTRLRTLQRLRERKEDQVDDLMQDMIKNHNFKGIGEFLRPLAKSKDQVKRHSFQLYQDVISSSLEGLINEVHRLLDNELDLAKNCKKVAESMDVLVAAKPELGDLLASKLNFAYEVPKLERRINKILCHFTTEITVATEKKDFVQMAMGTNQADVFLSNLKSHISTHNVEAFETAKDKVKLEVELIPQHVDKFFSARFEKGHNLFKAMSSLKQVAEMESFPKLTELYESTKKDIASKVRDKMEYVKMMVVEYKVYDDLIKYIHSLYGHLKGVLREHCTSTLVSECECLIEDLRHQKKENDRIFDFNGRDYEQNIDNLSLQLNCLSSTPPSNWLWSNHSTTYVRLCKSLLEKVEGYFNQAQVALNSRDLVSVQEAQKFLEHVHKRAHKHVKLVGNRLQVICSSCINAFLKLCEKAKQILASRNIIPFKEIFADYRSFVINIPCVLRSSSCKKEFAQVNQLLYEMLEQEVFALNQLANSETFDSSWVRSQVLRTRECGDFFADRLTLLHEEVSIYTQATPDKWLSNIHDLCWKHFNHGRDLSMIKDCAILSVPPSSSEADINKAYRDKARRFHPDKLPGRKDDGVMFRKIKGAHEKLLAMNHLSRPAQTQPFDETLIGVGAKLRDQAKTFLREQRYDMVENLLFELPNVKVLDDLVIPSLNSDKIISSIYSLVKGHVESVRIEVDSNWSARNYKDLNIIITELKHMESHFKAYPQIFPKSWDTGISRAIEAEIESLGQKASACLQSRAFAKQKEGDFRRCFINMGFVLVELPTFKAFTKSVMSCVLEKCLDSDWGYSYLFELGLSLQKGDESSSDSENRVAQMIVSEFSHFKEVLTMVWNEEVSKKPADETVSQIKGEHYVSSTLANSLNIERQKLLESFAKYEREYKSLLGDYIKPEADLNVLVHKTLALAKEVAPSHNGGTWGEHLKQKIPILLAGVFSVFTVLKSGASYNRIESADGSSDLGEKLLMKPHNIQVLTLLFMLGCGKSGQASLDSLLMEIRTGEGKSMILGAAATVFALLGFRVRTVCYSEYLSNRDYKLFEDLFSRFGLADYIRYSKISSFAEDSTAAKGDIRKLTEALLRGKLSAAKSRTIHNRLGSNTTVQRNKLHPQKRMLENWNFFKSSGTSPPLKLVEEDESNSSNVSSASVFDKSNIKAVDLRKPNNSKRQLTCQSDTYYAAVATNEAKPDKAKLRVEERQEILLVDEVDVFFGSEFYGQTYNQVVEFREPEIEEILKRIWNAWSHGGCRLKLNDIKSMPEYKRLLNKLSSFSFLLENEILLMLNQVSKVDDVPYYLDADKDRIGYKVMDSISYDATYGYTTVFTYLKEQRKLKNKGTLTKVLAMPVSCGQFSYANISPHRILGVSGTLNALGESERDILLKYGLRKFIYVPSVYGTSNFDFDKAGEGIYFESDKSDFFHRISSEITTLTKSRRAVIVFFRNRAKLNEFVASSTYRQLSRHKKLLTEDMNTTDKGYVINKAATSGQVTLSTAVFGRGTDFFCKDDTVQKNGGVHVIQTFLSEELSEEIQIRGRTARQGQRGSYQMVLLESDLDSDFGVPVGEKDKVAKKDLYDWLCSVRMQKHQKQCKAVEENLAKATEKDNATHKYLDQLLACNTSEATKKFEDLYRLMKKAPMPSSLDLDLAFAIDVTGSMAPYSKCIVATIESLISGQSNIVEKLKLSFPEIEFKLRVGCLPFRDIDDKQGQFQDKVWADGSHFTDNMSNALQEIKSACQNACGGFDIAEDHIGAIHRCVKSWNHTSDWSSDVKCLMLFSDAPTHGFALPSFSGARESRIGKVLRRTLGLSGASSYDSYPICHPDGLTMCDAISSLLSKNVDLFFCSFDPNATEITEEELSQNMKNHPENKFNRGIIRIPMVPKGQPQTNGSNCNVHGRHIVFVLDESSSMRSSWVGLVDAYKKYIEKRKQSQSESDLVSVVQFNAGSRVTVQQQSLSQAPQQLPYGGGMTEFHPAALDACKLARATPASHIPTIVFMSDGGTSEDSASRAAREFSLLNDHVLHNSSNDLELHVIAFGGGADTAQLQRIAGASRIGKIHASANTADLATVFVSIASNENVATLLQSEIVKQFSDAVSDKLSLEYFGN